MKSKKKQFQYFNYPDTHGFFGKYGGKYVPETLMHALFELDELYRDAKRDKTFKNEFITMLREYAGRPTPLTFGNRITEHYGRGKIYMKREDLCHTGAHKINNTIGQILLAKYMGKNEVIAETGAGQHGVATATAASLLGMKCKIFMGEIDANKQRINVDRMRLLGSEVIIVKSGGRVLKMRSIKH